MTADQIAKWRAAVAAHHKQQRQQRGKREPANAIGTSRPGMMRRPPPRRDGDGGRKDGSARHPQQSHTPIQPIPHHPGTPRPS